MLLLFLTQLLPLVVAQTCSQYGTAEDSSCLCPPGFNPASGSNGTCALPVCGGSLYDPGPVAPGGTGGFGNISAGSCGCTSGWTGPGCTVCQSASACSTSLTRYLNSSNSLSQGQSSLNSSLTCSSIPTVYSSAQMSCNVIQPTLQALFPLDSTLTITRSLNSSRTPGGPTALKSAGLTGGDAVVYAQLWYNGVEQFYCQGTGCTQSVNQDGGGSINGSNWDCPTLSCFCRPGTAFCGGSPNSTQNLLQVINGLRGPLDINCRGDGVCYFKQNLLVTLFGGDGLQLSSCSFGECVQQFVIDEALGITQAVPTSRNSLSGGVIAGLAVVGAILLAIIGIIIYGFIARRKARRNMRTDGVFPKSGGVGIAWSGVGYEVKSVGTGTWSRMTSWFTGSQPKLQISENGEMNGPNGGKIVLRDACGQLPAGGFCAILGPSGAGKSTLVDVLAGKRKGGKVQGKVAYMRKDSQRRVKVGYVDQSDVLSPTATVLETLLFAAYLRLPEDVPKSVKEERAHTVLGQLGLTDVAHTRVGSVEHRGISGGEMRRVSIGIELVAAPDVLVLDEPTSGLDSVSAARLVKLLKNLAEDEATKTTIVASIHQPSSALYHSFSQIVLLSNGRQLYFGPGGSRPAEFFAAQGRPCPPGYNIADHLLDIASGFTEGLVAGQAAVAPEVASSNSSHSQSREELEGGKSSHFHEHLGEGTPILEKNASYPPPLLKEDDREVDLAALSNEGDKKQLWPSSHCATTFLTQIEVLSGREWRNLKRDKTLLVAHVGLACLLGVFAGGLYYKVNLTIAGFQNRVGSMFFLGSLIAFSSLSALYNLVEVRGLFLRERAGSFYSSQAWLLSRVIFDVIPLRVIPTILVGIIVYFMVGLSHDAARFFKFLLIIVEFSLAMVLFNFLLACVFRHGGVAILLSSLCNLFLMTYAGFFVNIQQIPPVLRWLRYFSTLGYTLEALAINEVGSGLQIIDTLAGVSIEVNAVLIMETLFGFDLGNYYRDVLVLFAFIAGFGILLVLTVVYLLRERR